MNSDIKFYLSLFMRRLPVMTVIFMVFATIGAALALFLPPQYRASSVLLVESAQIPDELASSTVQTSSQEQLEIILWLLECTQLQMATPHLPLGVMHPQTEKTLLRLAHIPMPMETCLLQWGLMPGPLATTRLPWVVMLL